MNVPRKCETAGCTHGECEPRPDKLDQSTGTLPATTWECPCGWKRTEKADGR